MKTCPVTPGLPTLVPISAAEWNAHFDYVPHTRVDNKESSNRDRNRNSNFVSMKNWHSLISFSFPTGQVIEGQEQKRPSHQKMKDVE